MAAPNRPAPAPIAAVAPAAAWHWDASKLLARAERVEMNAEGGFAWPLKCQDMPGAVPTEDLDDPYIDNFLAASALSGIILITA